MTNSYATPGVYRQDLFLKPETKLPTGIPGFVGFATPRNSGEVGSPLALHRKEEMGDRFSIMQGSYLAETVNGFFDNGGVRCYVIGADVQADPDDPETALKRAVDALAPLNDLDLVAIPDAMLRITQGPPDTEALITQGTPDTEAVIRVQKKVLEHCAELGDRFAILDALPGSVEDVLSQRKSVTMGQTEPVNGALYYPWVRTTNMLVPPCGHVAGIFAKTDAKVGVFKAPANEEVLGVIALGVIALGVIDLEVAVDNQVQGQLNPEGVNCLRAFPGRGIRLWGARTLNRNSQWRYVNVRRLFLTLGRWIDLHMPWTAFEPNTPRLWVSIQLELSTYLMQLWRAGALKGESPDQAFYIKCDAETNPSEVREAGHVVTQIGLAPASPAEFVVVRVTHRAGTGTMA
jgi:hypothetical protein